MQGGLAEHPLPDRERREAGFGDGPPVAAPRSPSARPAAVPAAPRTGTGGRRARRSSGSSTGVPGRAAAAPSAGRSPVGGATTGCRLDAERGHRLGAQGAGLLVGPGEVAVPAPRRRRGRRTAR